MAAPTAPTAPAAAATAKTTAPRDQFVYVWLELVEVQAAAAQAAAAIALPTGSAASRTLQTLQAATRRVSALVSAADELLYMHILPSGKAAQAAAVPPSPGPVKQPESVSHRPGSGCCCCCPSRSSNGRDVKLRRGAAALSTRSRQPRRRLSESASDGDEDVDSRGRGRSRQRRQRRRGREDESEGDDEDDEDDEMRGNDVRLYDALVANRIRLRNPQARASTRTGPEQQEAAAASGRRSLTPRNGGGSVGVATRGRSPARSDRPSGAGSVSPARGHTQRQSDAQSPADGRKRRRTTAFPTHEGLYPGSAPANDGLGRMSKSEVAGLTAEAVLGMRWNYSQKEYKIRWVGLEQPVWIARRKCPNQAALLIEEYTKALRRRKRVSGRQQQERKTAMATTKRDKKSATASGNESESLYTVEKLMGVRTKHNKRQFLVRWDGYDSSEDTWEFVDELRKYVPEVVKEYEANLKRERERKAQEAARTHARRVPPARGSGHAGAEEADGRGQDEEEETLDKEQQRMLQVIRGGSDVEEEDDEEDDGMDHQEDSGDEEEQDDHAVGAHAPRYSAGRYSKPLYLTRSSQQDSDDDEDEDEDDRDALEAGNDLDDDMDEDEDDDHVSIDFGDSGIRRYTPLLSTRPTSGAGSVVESAKELLRRLRA